MAVNVTDRIDDPSKADVDRYVGLEHLDPESLRIRRWGKPADVEATKLRFQPGDVIFGKRRFYQRKIAVADFSGICSAHALVLRAKNEAVLSEFLPFLMQSDQFYERALAISVGSLSPTINWRSLARQEFPLPPIPEQRRIAEILWAAEKVAEDWQRAADIARKAYDVVATAAFEPTVVTSGVPADESRRLLVSDLAGLGPRPPKNLVDDVEVSFVPMEDVLEGGGIELHRIRQVKEVRNGYTFFSNGDIILPKITPCLENGKGALAQGLCNGMAFGSTEFIVIRPCRQEDTHFLYHLTMSPRFRRRAAASMRGSAGQKRVPKSFVLRYRTKDMTQAVRAQKGEQLRMLHGYIKAADIHTMKCKSILRALLSERLCSPKRIA